MNPLAWGAFGLAALASAGDLISILRRDKRLEYATKPAVMVFLIVAAVVVHPANQGERALFVVALALGLAGDVFLMLPDSYLLPGIAAFLGGHLAYAAGFRFAGFSALGLLAGLAIVVATASLFLHRVLGALQGTRERLRNPVIAYAIVISLMTVSATASGNLVAAAGGLLFFYSDVIFAWYRFVKPVAWGQPVNIVMYQLGQALLVLSLGVGS
jgi:uncharacterized membrane protein YhhN